MIAVVIVSCVADLIFGVDSGYLLLVLIETVCWG